MGHRVHRHIDEDQRAALLVALGAIEQKEEMEIRYPQSEEEAEEFAQSHSRHPR